MMIILHRYYFVYHLRTGGANHPSVGARKRKQYAGVYQKVADMSMLGSNVMEFAWCENNVIALVLAMCYVECGKRLNREYVEIAWRTL